MNKNPKLPIIDPIPGTLEPPSSKVLERKVYIKVVENITEYDYPQAVKTWQALEEAGIEPGEIIANALEQGHNYISNQSVVTQPFKEKQELPLAESIIEGNRLVSYQYITDENLISEGKTEESMEIILTSKEIAPFEEDNRPKAVKLIAILRKKLPNLLR